MACSEEDTRRAARIGGADDGQVVAHRRAEADADLVEVEVVDAGQRLPGVAEQLEDRAGGGLVVEALLFLACADDELAVAAGHEVDIGRAHHVLDERFAAQAQQLAFDGAQAERRGGRCNAVLAPDAGGDHGDVGAELGLAAGDSDAALFGEDAVDAGVGAQLDAALLGGRDERGEQATRIDLVVAFDEQSADGARRDVGLDVARLAGGEQPRGEAALAL